MHNTTLRALDLSNNAISEAGARLLADALKLPRVSLKKLDLSLNPLNNDGITHVVRNLNPSLNPTGPNLNPNLNPTGPDLNPNLNPNLNPTGPNLNPNRNSWLRAGRGGL